MATSVSSSTSATTTSTTPAVPAALVTAASVAAQNRTNAQKLITALGTDSGVDVASLAQNLVDAERVPKANAINAKITKNESRISGYSAIAYVATGVQNALNALKDERNFSSSIASVDNPATVTATAGPTATEGSHALTIRQLAKPQRSVFGAGQVDGFSSSTNAISGLTAGSLSLSYSYAGKTGTQTIAATNPTDIVKEINGNSPVTGVKAQLVFTGTDYKIVLSGKTGSANSFSLTDSTTSVVNVAAAQQSSTDALFDIDGVSYTRSSNQVGDALTGVTLNFKALSAKDSNGNFVSNAIDLTRDNSGLMAKVQDVVTAYNEAMSMLNVLSDPKSTVDTYGGALVGDSMVRTVREQLRNLMFTDSSAALSTSSIKSVRDLGISVDMTGTMTLDNAKLTDAFTNHFDEVVTAMTGNMNDLGEYSTAPAGIAGDASRALTKLLKTSGPIKSLSTNVTAQNTKYQEDLTNLQTRMDALLVRYQKQFAKMDSLVGSNNSLKASLKSTFDGMSKNNG